MEFYSLPYYHKKNLTYINPNQLRSYDYNQNIVEGVSISPIKPHSYNYEKIKNNEKNYRIYNNNIDNISNNRNYKNFSSDFDSKSVDLNHNIKARDKQKLRNSNSYSNVFMVNKNIKKYNNFFDYSNLNNNANANNYIARDDFWSNNNNNKVNTNPTSNLLAKSRSSSLFEERNSNNKHQFVSNEKNIYNDDFISNNEENIINKRLNNNNRSFSSYKSLNNKNYKYLFDYSSENNNNNSNNALNRDSNDNNLSLHDRYISPEYNLLKSKNFYKDNKSQQLFKSLNKFEVYFNNYKNMNNQMIKEIKNNITNNLNSNSISSYNSNKISSSSVNFNNKNIENLNKNESNYKENLLNYILNNSEIFKKIIDNALFGKSNIINNPYLLKNNKANINGIMHGFYLPQKSKENMNKKTLLLDLDETLVHSSFKPLPMNSDIHFNVIYQNKPHMINVLTRPFVYEFLLKMSNLYEIVIFTASVPQYANPLLNILDKNKCISHRLFRQHCISLYGLFIKDLRRIGRDLKDTILLDNNPISYLVNQENGLPIKTWHSNKNDQELIKIIPLLEYLAKNEINDVREILKKIVVNNMIDYNLVNSIIYGNNINSVKKANLSHANSFKNIDNIINNKIINENRNKYLTPKKVNSNNILINNYNKNESYNKSNNNNININIINFNISKLYMNEDIKHNSNQNNHYNSNKIRNNIPISKKPKKSKNEKKLNNILESNNKKSKEDIESIINSKYKYLGHIINNRKQNKNIRIFNKEMDNSKRNYSQKDIFSDKINQINKNNTNNVNQINRNYFQEIPYRKANNNISKENINYLYNNFLVDDLNNNKINEIKNNNKISLLKNFYYFNSEQINNNINNINNNYNNNKLHHRASTPSVINHHFNIIKNNNNSNNSKYYMYKEYINHNNMREIYKYT